MILITFAGVCQAVRPYGAMALSDQVSGRLVIKSEASAQMVKQQQQPDRGQVRRHTQDYILALHLV